MASVKETVMRRFPKNLLLNSQTMKEGWKGGAKREVHGSTGEGEKESKKEKT